MLSRVFVRFASNSRSSALEAIYRAPAVVRYNLSSSSPAIPTPACGLEIPQVRSTLPAERLARYGKKVEQRGWVAVLAFFGFTVFAAFQFSVFFFDVASPLHLSLLPQLLQSLSPVHRRTLVASLARTDLLPEDLASEDPYLCQRDFVGKKLLFPLAVHAASATHARALIKLGFGAVEISDQEISVHDDELTRHALVGLRTNISDPQQISDLLEIYDWVTLDCTEVLPDFQGKYVGNIFLRVNCEPNEQIAKIIFDHKIAGVCLTEVGLVEAWGEWVSRKFVPGNFRLMAPLQAGSVTSAVAAGAGLLMAEEISDFRVARRAKNELTHALIGGGFYDVSALIGSKWRTTKTARERSTERNKHRF